MAYRTEYRITDDGKYEINIYDKYCKVYHKVRNTLEEARYESVNFLYQGPNTSEGKKKEAARIARREYKRKGNGGGEGGTPLMEHVPSMYFNG